MSTNKVFGLVLAGGKSSRMGSDKGKLDYHGKPQREYAYSLLQSVCDRVFYSIRASQKSDFENEDDLIIDQDNHRGPFNGMLSAHQRYPEVAWLVLATDLPLLKEQNLQTLLKQRNPESFATAFATRATKLPEPLIAIWEPHGLKNAKQYLMDGNGSCPRKFLLNTNVSLVYVPDDAVLMNANTQEEFQLANQKLTNLGQV